MICVSILDYIILYIIYHIILLEHASNKLLYAVQSYDLTFVSIILSFQRVGYLAASQSFHEGTDVLMLTTNMIRKDLGSHSMYDAGVALNGLSCFLTADLARDLANDIMTLVRGQSLLIGQDGSDQFECRVIHAVLLKREFKNCFLLGI